MLNPIPFLFSVTVYASFWICLAGFILFVGDFGIVKSVGFPHTSLPPALAAAANLGLIALFGLQHSIMARPGFKRLVPRRTANVERSIYVLMSVLMLCLMMTLWQPIGGTLWTVQDGLSRLLLHAVFAAGWLIILLATIEIDHWHFFGLRQTWNALRGLPCGEPAFREQGLYARVRHPIHFGMLLALWAAPDMSFGRLLLAALMTIYVLIGLRLEERDLTASLGGVYGNYRKRVPMLLPALRVGGARSIDRVRAGLLFAAVALGAGAAFSALSSRVTLAADAVGTRATLSTESIHFDGRERSFRLYRPVAVANRPAVIIALHGSGVDGSAKRAWVGASLERLADRHGLLVAYPDGYENHWNDCRRAASYSANRLAIDDVGFLGALVAHLAAREGIDPDRVFVLGFSNGGQMGYRLALEAPGMVRAVAVLGAGLPVTDNLDCAQEGRAVPLLLMLGADDEINPVDGGVVTLNGRNHGGEVRSGFDSAAYFARLCAACTAPVTHQDASGDTHVVWPQGERPWVVLQVLADAGHTVAQPHFEFPHYLGATRRDIDTIDVVWQFFSAHLPDARAQP